MSFLPSRSCRESLTCMWQMRSPNSSTKSTGSRNWCTRWLGSKLKPNAGWLPTASSARLAVIEVVGDLAGMDLEGELTPCFVELVEDGRPAVGEVLVAGLDACLASSGGKIVGHARPASR